MAWVWSGPLAGIEGAIPFGWTEIIFDPGLSGLMLSSILALAIMGSGVGIVLGSQPKPPRKPDNIDWTHGTDIPWPKHDAPKIKTPWKRDSSFLRTAEQRRQHFRELATLVAELKNRAGRQTAPKTPIKILDKDIDPEAVIFTIFNDTGIGSWVGYRPQGHNHTRLYHLQSENATLEEHYKAVAELEQSFAHTLDAIVSSTTGLISDIGAAKFYHLLERNAQQHIHANRTLIPPSLKDFAQEIIDAAHQLHYLSSHFKCGGRLKAPCPSSGNSSALHVNENSSQHDEAPVEKYVSRFVCGDKPPMIKCPETPVGGKLEPWAIPPPNEIWPDTDISIPIHHHHATGHGPVVPWSVLNSKEHQQPYSTLGSTNFTRVTFTPQPEVTMRVSNTIMNTITAAAWTSSVVLGVPTAFPTLTMTPGGPSVA